MVKDIIEFDRPRISPSIIMVAGVGGGGSNAVNHMFELGIADVSFMVCNTDRQALYSSPVPIKVRLGDNSTQGLGAGNNPDRGCEAALESLDEIIEIFKREGTKMVFITAGMGGGTGTGAAPVIAKAAKELGILTVAIVTVPFKTEGPKRMNHAKNGIEQLMQHVDSLLLVNNENIQEIYGKLTLSEAFGKADDILATAAKGIAEVITRENTVNVDFADVQAVMSNSGIALMGSGRASGEQRAIEVANAALSSPLLNHNDIEGAKNILINITSGAEEVTMEEVYLITEYIQERSGNAADIIWGAGIDKSLGNDIEVTIIATGFNVNAVSLGFSSKVTTSPMQTYFDANRVEDCMVESGEEVLSGEAQYGAATQGGVVPGVATQGAVVAPGHIEPQTEEREFNRPAYGGRVQPRQPLGNPLERGASANPLSQPAPQPQIESKRKEEHSDANIDELENMPAFVRRNMRFVNDKPEEGGSRSRVVIKDESSQNEAQTPTSSLFD